MKWMKRIIRNWLGVSGDAAYPHRFVSMMYWRDEILAVDGNGDIYQLIYREYDLPPYVQLMMKNPLER